MMVDNYIRAALVVAVCVLLPFAVYFRARSVTAETLDRWQEGAFILFGLRLSGLPAFIGGITWMIDPQQMAWSSMALPPWLRWLGVVFVGCSASLTVWTFWNLGGNLTDTVVTRRNHTLITSGPFRFVRHPFYLAIAWGGMGMGVAMANVFMLLAPLLPVGFLAARTRIEEQKLIERFGMEYQDYMRRVGRFLPRRPSKPK